VLAGYEVAAIDAYADAQTLALCKQVRVVAYDKQGFDANALLTVLQTLVLAEFSGFVYGSGFEAQPELLNKVAQLLPLIGNGADAVADVKNPLTFFAALQKHNIQYPARYDALANDASNMLIKAVGGCGGAHIQDANAGVRQLSDQCYLQQKIQGDAVSLLFIANRHGVDSVGFNLQWLSEAAHAPYRYGGAAGNAELSAAVKAQLLAAAEKLTREFALRGLNSLDAIVNKDVNSEQVYVLEINPRLSATLDLYSDAQQNLFEKHVQACLGQNFFKQQNAMNPMCKAQAVVYADTDLRINQHFVWPDWVKDNPSPLKKALKIKLGEPVCTVTAEAKVAQAAKVLAQNRAEKIQQLLKQK